MKIIFILLFYTSVVSGYYINPETSSIGEGVSADITGPAAIIVNPAGISDSIYDYFSISIIKPVKFYNFSLLFMTKNNWGLGATILQIENFYTYETAFGIRINEHFNTGINVSLAREIPLNEKQRYDFSISPGFQAQIKEFTSSFPFELKLGLFIKNLASGKKLKLYEEYSKLNYKFGVMFKFLLPELSFYFGGEYIEETVCSFGADYPVFDFLRLRLGYKEKDEILLGIMMGEIDEYGSAGINYNLKEKTEHYIISYTKSFGAIKLTETSVKEKSRYVSKKTLSKQKELIAEGLRYYRQKDYSKAKQVWQKAYWLAPYSKYGKEARKYLNRVNNILEKLGE